MSNDIASNRSALKDFLASIATISGDLSNITAPPFVLAENSTVEIPQYWADHPSLFVAQAAEEDAEKRALSVLKYFIGTLRNQQYAGRREEDGVKKPLNAFLGELFLGGWKSDEIGETRLVAEQVSHHPPVTACYLWNDKHGVRAQGFTQQEITFSGNVSIKQKGYAILHLDRFDEDYLIPVPDIKVKGLLSGTPYPELHGDYSLISSSGYVSHLKFEGKSLFGSGQKNGFEAKLFHADRPSEILYEAKGAWNGVSSFVDARTGLEIEVFDVNALTSATIDVGLATDQDPWESRRAWGHVIAALHGGNMKGVAEAKARLEEGQRQMRRDEEACGKAWTPVFFKRVEHDAVFDKLSSVHPDSFTVDTMGGIWKIKEDAVQRAEKPFHGDLGPANVTVGGGHVQSASQDSGETGGARQRGASHNRDPVPALDGDEHDEAAHTARDRETNRVSEVDTRAEDDAPPHWSRELSNAQVEAYLRAQHSNGVR